MQNMLVNLLALPDSRPVYDELNARGIRLRRALTPDKKLV